LHKTTNEKVIKKTVISKDTIHKTFNKSVFLNDLASKEMNNWKHFDEFQNAITNFYQTTPEKAKLNAKDLSIIIVKIKDSITIEKLNKPDVIARLNILNNEALRLHDMSTISTITNEEVNAKIENIIYAYESIIAKINQVYILNANEESVDVRFSAPKVLNDSVINTKKPSETELNKLKIIKQRQ
jgi:hypothetical protein